jgi:hypothetical protein
MTELSNWRRRGKDDQVGAVNLMRPAKRKQAMALVKEGPSFSMARDAETEKAVDNAAPIVHQITRVGVRNQSGDFGGSADTFFISYHGTAHTHIYTLSTSFTKARCITAIR